MVEKKHMYETKLIALSPLNLVLGDIPVPEPDSQRKTGLEQQKMNPEIEGTVKQLIAHLKDENRWRDDVSHQK